MMDYNGYFSRAAAGMQESAIRKMGALGGRVPDLISFAPGFPAAEMFAWDEFRDVAQTVLDGSDAAVLQYGPTRGYRPLVEALPQILGTRGIHAMPDDVIVTTGSQQALDLTARVFIDPGAVVLVELPTYTGAITAFRNAQAALVGQQGKPESYYFPPQLNATGNNFPYTFFGLEPGNFRHWDHRFEWTREEFKNWADKICLEYPGYTYETSGIGEGPARCLTSSGRKNSDMKI